MRGRFVTLLSFLLTDLWDYFDFALQYSVEKRRNLFFLTSLGYQSQMFTQEESTLLHIFRCKLILKFIVAKFLNTSATYAITVQLIISIARAFKFIIVPCEANMLTAMASRTRVYGCVKKCHIDIR